MSANQPPSLSLFSVCFHCQLDSLFDFLTYKISSLLHSQNTGFFSAPQQLLDNPSTKNNQVFFKLAVWSMFWFQALFPRRRLKWRGLRRWRAAVFKPSQPTGPLNHGPFRAQWDPHTVPRVASTKSALIFFPPCGLKSLDLGPSWWCVLCSFLPFFKTEHVFVYKHRCFGFFVAMRGWAPVHVSSTPWRARYTLRP